MGTFNLAHRPRVASPEPGSTIHRTLNDPKVTKHTRKAARTAQEEVKRDAQTDDIIMTDVATNIALTNDNSPATDRDPSNEADRKKRKSYTLKDYMPKIGMIYPTGKPQLLRQSWKNDAEILRALWSQQDTGDKTFVQALIAPAFNYAVQKIQLEGLNRTKEEEISFQGGDLAEDNYSYEEPGEEDIKNMWDTFLGELWYEFPKTTWVRKLSKLRFACFFSVLADARLRERCYPKNDGAEHPELVRAISKFLGAASEAGTCWMTTHVEDRDEDGH